MRKRQSDDKENKNTPNTSKKQEGKLIRIVCYRYMTHGKDMVRFFPAIVNEH